MKLALPIARVLLGLRFLVFGLNTFLMFMEPPAEMPSRAQALLTAFGDSEFMHPIRGAIETLCGALLVLGLWVPLALVMLAPVLVHIIAYHVFLDPAPGAIGFTALLVSLDLFVAWKYRANFKSLFAKRASA